MRIKLTLIVVCFLLIWLAPFLNALQADRLPTQYRLTFWNEENGLPQSSIHALIQTRDGYVWLGTEEGLVRFDGLRFQVYSRGDTPELKSNYISCLFEDKDGTLWIGTKEGLLTLQTGKFSAFDPGQKLIHPFVYCISEDSAGSLWVGTDGSGLLRIREGSCEVLTQISGLRSDVVRTVYEDADQRLWVGTSNGINTLEGGVFKSPPRENLFSNTNIYVFLEDGARTLWVGTDDGLHFLRDGRWLRRDLGGDLKNNIINEVYEDGQNTLWVGTGGGGLVRIREDNVSRFTKKEGFADNWISAVMEDDEGSLWVGTIYGGIHLLQDVNLRTFNSREGLAGDVAFCIFEDSEERIWIGTNNGLSLFHGDRFRNFTVDDGLTDNTINSICQDRDGHLWLGTDDGLTRFRYRGEGYPTVRRFLKNHLFLSVYCDSRGTVWTSSNRGIQRRDNGRFTRVDPQNLFGAKLANYFIEDPDGALWISAYRVGLIKYYGDGDLKNRLFTNRDGLGDTGTMCVHMDDQSSLWIGTTGGLSRYTDGKFFNFTQKNGLFNDNIYTVLPDGHGRLWMSCNKGVFFVPAAQLEALAAGKISLVQSVVFGKDEGMRSRECIGGIQPAGWKDSRGRLWFPTMKGVSVVDPGALTWNRVPPPVRVEAVLLDGREAAQEETIQVQSGVRRVEIRFTCLSFVLSPLIQFKYRLSGFDTDWVDAGTQRRAFFTSLRPGTYAFQVKARNNHGVWSTELAQVSLKVLPPFWWTWWFIIGAVVVFAFLSYLLIGFLRRYIKLIAFWKKEKFVGHFQIIDKIASGGMGTIYKAKDLMNASNIVAVKILRDEYFEDDNMKQRFERETSIIHQLEHPHIIRVFERGEFKKTQYFAMEYLKGETLSTYLAREKAVPVPMAVRVILQVGEALSFIHSKNIIHRDLKPENVMLTRDDSGGWLVKLLDFGLAKTELQTRLTQTGMVLGTLHYLSPEQIKESHHSPAGDVYSLGIIFYEILAGRKPFAGDTTVAVMKQILDETPDEPVHHNPGIPAPINALIMQMVEKDPDGRPGIDQVLTMLNFYLENQDSASKS